MNDIERAFDEWTDIFFALRELNERQRIEFMIRLRTAAIDVPAQTLVNMIDGLLNERSLNNE